MEMSINELLQDIREKNLCIEEQRREDFNEKNRQRNLQEANIIIANWKKEHSKKRVTKVKISICREYNSHFDRFYYKLRLFIDGNLDSIFNIEENAGNILTSGVEYTAVDRFEMFTLFTN